MKNVTGFILATCCLFLLPLTVLSQPRKATQGSIDFEEAERRKDPYLSAQEEAIQFYETLDTIASALSTGKATEVPNFSEEALHYLTGVYLYCMSKRGVCPVMVKSILEVDIMQSILSGKADCQNMLQFWKLWIDNGMEKRHSYMVSTGHLKLVDEFNKNIRPGLIRCVGTVEKQIQTGESAKEILVRRYAEGSYERKMITGMKGYLQKIRDNVPNVFVATGAGKASRGVSSAPSRSSDPAPAQSRSSSAAPAKKTRSR